MKPESRPNANRDSLNKVLPLRVVARIEDSLIAVLVFAIFCIVLASIVSRLFLHYSLSWSIEVSVDLMIWMTFIGIAVGIRDRVHVAFELFEGRLRGRALVAASFVQMLLMGFLLFSLAWGGWQFTELGLGQISPSGIPQWIPFSAIPVGSMLGLVHLAVCMGDVARGVESESVAAHGFGHPEAGAP